MDSVERLKGLYQDLVAFSETRLANVERLSVELQASIEDFRKLLDKSAKSNASRQAFTSGMSLRCLTGVAVSDPRLQAKSPSMSRSMLSTMNFSKPLWRSLMHSILTN